MKISRYCLLAGLSVLTVEAASIGANVAYYVNETSPTVISSASSNGTTVSTFGSFEAPSGSTMSGLAGFDNGRFFASSTLTRAGAFDFNEGLTSAVFFRDVLTIDTGGYCPAGGGLSCQLILDYTADGTCSATGLIAVACQIDVAILNPATPEIRSSWLVDNPAFFAPGDFSHSGSASIEFFDNTPLDFWPVFATVARQVAGSNGTSTIDSSNSFVFNSFSVAAPGGAPIPFNLVAESGLTYDSLGISGVPEPGTWALFLSGLTLVAIRRRQRA